MAVKKKPKRSKTASRKKKAKKSRSAKKQSKAKKTVTKKRRAPRKKARSKARSPTKKTRSTKRAASKPAKSLSTAQKSPADIKHSLDRYAKKTGYKVDKPASIEDFDRRLEETAKLVASDEPLSKKKLPGFTEEHVQEAKVKEQTHSSSPGLVGELKKPETPNPDHHSFSSHQSHPYTENPHKGFHQEHPHQKESVLALVLAFVGVIVPVISIIAFIMALKAAKKGSHTAKGTALLSVATFIINLALIYLFYTYVWLAQLA